MSAPQVPTREGLGVPQGKAVDRKFGGPRHLLAPHGRRVQRKSRLLPPEFGAGGTRESSQGLARRQSGNGTDLETQRPVVGLEFGVRQPASAI